MDFLLLGPVVVERDDRGLALGGPKPRALLAMLLLEANRPVSRDRLIEGLWGEQPPGGADHGLDDYVSRLRKVLGPERIERRAPGYVLHSEPDELDIARFREAAERGRALAADNPVPAARLLREALGMWRGAALADVLDEPFAAEAARRLEDERQSALEDRIEADLIAGDGSQLVPELQALVREHPLNERLSGQLMRALYASGRQAEALAAFQSIRRRLASEVGLEVSSQLRELEHRILVHDPGLAALPATDRAQPVRAARRSRVRGLVFASGAIALSVGAGIILGLGGSRGATHRSRAGDRLVAITARGTGTGVSGALPGAAAALAAGGGALWVAAPDVSAVVRADPASGAAVDRIPLPDAPGKVAFGDGAVWATTGIGRTVVRIDPATGTIVQTIRLGIEPADIAFAHGELWVADPGDRALLRIDTRSGIVRKTVELPARPSAVAINHDVVWVASHDDGSVLRIDARSNALVDTVDVGQGPSALIATRDAVWATNSLDGTVSRIDPRNGNVVATVQTGSGPAGVTASGKTVWVANRYSRTVSQLDSTTNNVVRTVRVHGEPTALASAGGKVWVGVRGAVEHRGGTLVLLFSRRYLSIDPQVDYERPPAQYLGLAYDGLVAWNHTEGADGLQLVPDLAIKLPVPEDRGRTYRFRLRPGIRYTDGRSVKASDFARAILRLRAVHSPGVPHFAALKRTDGVVADDNAGTLVFHLSAPDPEFLLKLASGLVVPIPHGTPMHDVGSEPLPGTGPYRIADVSAGRIRFVRNLRFHEWSRAAQPDGNPDVIEWRFGLTPAEQAHAVATRRADWSDEPPPDLATIARLPGGTLHSKAFPITTFVQINTRRPPFNDVRARRALNYAVDRARVAHEFGGPLAATPTCQVLPPGVDGYRPYCPYSRGAARAAKWRAPDMRRARALVAASGTRGARVTLWTVADGRGAEPGMLYLARLLRRLGYRAHLQRITSTRMARASPALRARMQLLPIGFGPDYPSAYAFFSTFIACGGPFTFDQFCDHGVDREIQRAQQLGVTNARAAARAWAVLDRRLVDRAIWLPLVNLRIVDFTSKRVHGYQSSPIYHFLPAQAWIHE